MPATTYYAQSLTEMLANRVRDQPDSTFIYTGIPDDEGPAIRLRSLTFSQVQKAVDRLAWYYYGLGLVCKTSPGSLPPPARIIAVFTSSAFDESLLEMALSKLGLVPLLLSINNSVSAVANLSKVTNASHLIYSAKFVQEAEEVQAQLRAQGYALELLEDKRLPLWGAEGVEATPVKSFPAVFTPDQEKDRIAVILHSSGSTGFPKPIYITHYGFIANSSWYQNKPGFSTLPVYHGYGHLALFRCMYFGQPFTLFPPHLPLTSANICAVFAASPHSRLCFAVPYVIKLLGETSQGTEALANFDIVGYSGAAVPDDLGDRLVKAGVNLLSSYGTTETGTLLSSVRDYATDKAWNWMRPFQRSVDYIVMEPRGSNTYEMVVKDGFPPKVESNRPDRSYATKDLFVRHPVHQDWYKYVGRLDDTLVQILGEKTNPVPIELCIRGNSPYVAEAIVFGDGMPQTGCLILPSDLGKDLSRDQLMEKIWPVVEQANSEAPTHSRLLPEMIEFLPYGTHIPVATKMSILRPACYSKFRSLIESIYDRFEHGADAQKVTLSRGELEDFILDTIARTLGTTKVAKLDKDVDLFAFGVDSLQATRIRNMLQKSLELRGQVLGQNVVYEHQSVRKLAAYILAMQAGDDTNVSNEQQQQQEMLNMLHKWSSKLEFHRPSPRGDSILNGGHVIVLTGATGSLGAHILSNLVASPAVRKIICLSRAPSHASSLDRVKQSLRLRKLTIDDETKVEAYASNPNADHLLGLSQREYDHIRNEATIVIHNAWPVNFVLSVGSFDEHVGGALNLINLCLQSPRARPAMFYFSSSVSSRQGAHEATTCAEDFSPSPSTAAGTGYARSKWVTEKLCQTAAAATQTGIKIGVLRIGQMSGDSVHGVWNETESWPLMFNGADTIGFLPRIDEHPSWLPVDYAGVAIAEIVLQPNPPSGTSAAEVYHIVNPDTSASWDDILVYLKDAGVKFEAVDKTEWLHRLATTSDPDPERNPVIKLLPFFQDRFGGERRAMVFSTDRTAQAAPSIASAPAINRDLVRKWVEHWRDTGFLRRC